jgi:hypothetical protein
MPEWLEMELAEALRPAAAPTPLWDRIWEPRRKPRPRVIAWAAWPIAAAVALAIAAGILWFRADGKQGPPDLRQLAIEQLRDASPLELRSSDPAEINRWLREHTGAEVRLPPRTGAELLGARVIRAGGVRVGAVAYRVGESEAMLLVAHSGAGDAAHGRLAWSARGVSYALAYADETHSEAACRLCHTNL